MKILSETKNFFFTTKFLSIFFFQKITRDNNHRTKMNNTTENLTKARKVCKKKEKKKRKIRYQKSAQWFTDVCFSATKFSTVLKI